MSRAKNLMTKFGVFIAFAYCLHRLWMISFHFVMMIFVLFVIKDNNNNNHQEDKRNSTRDEHFNFFLSTFFLVVTFFYSLSQEIIINGNMKYESPPLGGFLLREGVIYD